LNPAEKKAYVDKGFKTFQSSIKPVEIKSLWDFSNFSGLTKEFKAPVLQQSKILLPHELDFPSPRKESPFFSSLEE